ncbi:discoidin domain-containing protein [Alloacidobacterium dinghuense]|uniref:Discoidin domain-containing protein n=2 Tax=Alloacidobacterium dinghuense TaxID=2763107 RepID=A0A7G8BEC0_9BACT|nr:discoidin domain-containing protein [Alloacidobacterium dinghuense]
MHVAPKTCLSKKLLARKYSTMSQKLLITSFLILLSAMSGAGAEGQTITVDATPSHVANTFSPLRALGTTVDRIPSNTTDIFFRPDQIKQILEAGWGPVTYRQNTELFVQAWHWNPKGTWSDSSGQGYFVGDAKPTNESIRHSYGYNLPHRGVTRNNGSEFDGYSRLDDGDLNTYWKSNPYLTKAFTGEDDSLHPQWVVVRLQAEEIVTNIRIAWAEPYARNYRVQYWLGKGDAMDDPEDGEWKDFPSGVVSDGKGGTVTLQVSPTPLATRYVRVLMTESSNTCDTHGKSDPRNCVGYAIKEIYLGTQTNGEFHDILHHTPGQDQTFTFSSSIDPWHQPSDLYVIPDRMESGDQVGFDLFFTSGITRGQPAMVPVALLYGTPEDAAAQITYLEKRGYPISYIEMGEEPDGQYMAPEDYATLYLQWATALHKIDPDLKLGGPVFEGVSEDIKFWPDAQGKTSWFTRFLDYLKAHNRLSDLSFMSYEHYPYYDGTCQGPWSNLFKEPEVLTHIVQVWRDDGLPANVPMFNTETNAPGGDAAVDVFGALWLGETFPAFLTAGGKASYYHHALPYSTPHPACWNSWGTYHMFTTDHNYLIKQRTSQFFATQMLTQEWAEPGDGEHRLFHAASDIKDSMGRTLVTAYAVQRPDGQWSLMVINKDYDNPHSVKIAFHDADTSTDNSYVGPVTRITFGKEQYRWHSAMRDGYADPDGPADKSTLPDGARSFVLPPASMTVLRGRISSSAK